MAYHPIEEFTLLATKHTSARVSTGFAIKTREPSSSQKDVAAIYFGRCHKNEGSIGEKPIFQSSMQFKANTIIILLNVVRVVL